MPAAKGLRTPSLAPFRRFGQFMSPWWMSDRFGQSNSCVGPQRESLGTNLCGLQGLGLWLGNHPPPRSHIDIPPPLPPVTPPPQGAMCRAPGPSCCSVPAPRQSGPSAGSSTALCLERWERRRRTLTSCQRPHHTTIFHAWASCLPHLGSLSRT